MIRQCHEEETEQYVYRETAARREEVIQYREKDKRLLLIKTGDYCNLERVHGSKVVRAEGNRLLGKIEKDINC